MENAVLFDNAKIWTDKDILYCKIKNKKVDRDLELNILEQYITAADNLCQDKLMPFIIDLRFIKGAFSVASAKLLAESPLLNRIRMSEAFVVNSIGIRLLILSYKRIYNPQTPFIIVDNIKSAVEYSLKIKDHNAGS